MRRIVAIVGVVGLSLAWTALPASAGASTHFVSTPASGPPGTVIHASGDSALDDSTCDIVDEDIHVEVFGPNENSVASGDTTVNSDFTWQVDVTIPAGAAPGHYVVTAFCSFGAETDANYISNPFTVTAAVQPTTTTTVLPLSTTTTTVAPQAVPVAPAAAPVVAAPVMTG